MHVALQVRAKIWKGNFSLISQGNKCYEINKKNLVYNCFIAAQNSFTMLTIAIGFRPGLVKVQLSERLASLGIMIDKLRTPLKPLESSQHYRIEALKGVLNWAPVMPRDAIFSDSCTSDLCSFFFSVMVFRNGNASDATATRCYHRCCLFQG